MRIQKYLRPHVAYTNRIRPSTRIRFVSVHLKGLVNRACALQRKLSLWRQRIQNYTDTSVHTYPDTQRIQKFPLWRAYAEKSGYTERIRRTRVDARCIRPCGRGLNKVIQWQHSSLIQCLQVQKICVKISCIRHWDWGDCEKLSRTNCGAFKSCSHLWTCKTPAGKPITFFHLACSLLSTNIPQAQDRRGANDPTIPPQFEQASYFLCLQTFPIGNYIGYICTCGRASFLTLMMANSRKRLVQTF